MSDEADAMDWGDRLADTASLLPPEIAAEIRAEDGSRSLLCSAHGRTVKLSETARDGAVQLVLTDKQTPPTSATFRTPLEAAVALADSLGVDWDGQAEPLSTADPRFLAAVEGWMDACGEVLLVIWRVFGAGDRSFELLPDMGSLRSRLATLRPADCVVALRERHLPIRGRVDEEFVASALAAIPDGSDWVIACREPITMGRETWLHWYPGNNHIELAEELRDEFCFGKHVAVGLEPPYGKTKDGVLTAFVPNPDGTVTPGAY